MNTKLCKKDFCILSGILLFTALAMIILILPGKVYGSATDWVSQHTAIPDYFRQRFYQTHQLFPSYAANIGAGENIYSLSYYGLYSPVILLSYALPFVPMPYYIMMTGVVTVFASEALFYFFFRKYYNIKTTAFTTALFALSVPLLFQSHRHIMFIEFMPFLLVSMFLTDRYFRTGRKAAICACAFLMIMCNYFFAVTSLCALGVYGLMKVIDEHHKSLSSFVKRFIPFVMILLVSVLMSCVLLLPTAYVLLSGRDENNIEVSLKSFLPTIRYDWLTYYGYAMGLTGFGVYASIAGIFYSKGSRRFISALTIIFAVCPVFVYVLNGTLYFDAKVLFAFLPLALFSAADLIDEYIKNGAHKTLLPLITFLFSTVVSFIVCGTITQILFFVADAVIVTVFVMILRKKRSPYICAAFLLVPLAAFIGWNRYDYLYPVSRLNTVNSEAVTDMAKQATSGEFTRLAVDTERRDTSNKVYTMSHYLDTVYSSIHSKEYNSFYFNEITNENEYRNSALTARSRNLFFNCFMGDRFYITNKPVSYIGFELLRQQDGYYLYQNNNAYPLVYDSDYIMSRRQYDKLEYPDKTDALMRCCITEDDIPDVSFESSFTPCDIGPVFDVSRAVTSADSAAVGEDGKTHITLANNSLRYEYPLPEQARGKIILLRFYVENIDDPSLLGSDKAGDVEIIINGVRNTLTNRNWKYFNNNNYFEYVLSDCSDSLDISLKGSTIDISELKCFTFDPLMLEDMCSHKAAFEPDIQKTQGDVISGRLFSENGGYACTSFVYHKGFEVLVNGKPVKPELVNTAFLGFKLPAGDNDIKISFKAPFLNAGIAVSAVGGVLYIIMIIHDILRSKRKRG